MVAASAISAWLVQMLLVAFSRRMCCSRACSVSVYARRPRWSTLMPTSRPGRRRAGERGEVFQGAEERRLGDDQPRVLLGQRGAHRVERGDAVALGDDVDID